MIFLELIIVGTQNAIVVDYEVEKFPKQDSNLGKEVTHNRFFLFFPFTTQTERHFDLNHFQNSDETIVSVHQVACGED
jgi:hypothetical protein